MKTIFHPFKKISWIDGYYLQLEAFQDAAQKQEHVFFFEHKNVITLGTSSKKEDIPNSLEIRQKKIKIFQTNRGGEATWHGEGQLVFYPVLNIKKRKIKAPELVKRILKSTQKALFRQGFSTVLDTENPGLYMNEKKVASFGMTIKKGVTLHGVSVNINNKKTGFNTIKPCGMSPEKMSTISKEGQKKGDIELISKEIQKALQEDF